jgi:DNA mismatch repair protein MutS
MNKPMEAPTEPQRLTPMMAQYFEIKAAYPDCLLFYRMGDFYEMFFDDAEIASHALGIVLTKRGKHDGADIRMCGVPVERADDYLQRLISKGHRVAVCEQIEDPAEAKKRGGKSVVSRAVVRLVTPGTITEERLLEPGRANVLLALCRTRAGKTGALFGFAALDLSTGAFSLSESDGAALSGEIARIGPSEIIAADALVADPDVSRILADSGAALTPIARAASDATLAEKRMCEFYGVQTLDGFGAFTRAEIAAAAMALSYLTRTQKGARPSLAPPARRIAGQTLEMDSATRANLELTRTLSGERAGSLLATIDMTLTPAGARMLAERLASPLTSPSGIDRRLDAIERLIEHTGLRTELRERLRAVPDFERALSRLALDRGGPRDLQALGAGLSVARAIRATLSQDVLASALIADAASALEAASAAIERELVATLDDDVPLERRDGGFVRAGADPVLDEARALRDQSRVVIAQLQTRYCELAETRQLRIKHNNFLGYFIETAQAHGERMLKPPLAATFIHRQTLAGAMRFSTAELAELQTKILSAADKALSLELAIFERLRAACLAEVDAIRRVARALAELDVVASLAELAVRRDWRRPRVDESLAFIIEGGRHPVVEAALSEQGEAFCANDCDLSGEVGDGGRIALITGPNMAGKSTYLRQNALIAALAQMGSFVPARSAHIGIVDRLFSRVGAADDLARGRSTFMVEMVETAAILNRASPRSLIILDEIGRGTATYDGLSIALATVEHLHAVNRSRTLFATHFHEMTRLTTTLPRLIRLTVRVAEWKGSLVFLHEVIAGVADRSYGVQVARLAGLPGAVLERARAILADLEANSRANGGLTGHEDLPLFAAAPAPAKREDALRQRLAEIDPDEMSPREAHDALYALKQLASGTDPS